MRKIEVMSRILVATLAGMAMGCAGMADTMTRAAGIGTVSEETGSDSTRTVYMSPAWLYKPGDDLTEPDPVKLGALWTSASPDFVALTLQHSFEGSRGLPVEFSEASIEINGEDTIFSMVGKTRHETRGYENSTKVSLNYFLVPMPFFESMLSAKKVLLDVKTDGQDFEAELSIERMPGGQSTAILHLRDFMAHVRKNIKP